MKKKATPIDPRDGITREEVSSAARILQQGEQPDLAVEQAVDPDALGPQDVSPDTPLDVSVETVEPEADTPPAADPKSEPAPPLPKDFRPTSCLNCGTAGAEVVLPLADGQFRCTRCGHTWDRAAEQAPFRRYLRPA